MIIARTGFYTSIVSYLVFLLADAIKPGFVSNYMSVHWFLLAAILFAVWWAYTYTAHTKNNRSAILWVMAVLLGLVAGIVVWKAGTDLENFRILSSILAFVLPSIILGVLRSSD